MSIEPDLRLSTVIGAAAWRDGLKRAAQSANDLTLDFVEVSPIHRAFAPMAREQKFAISEMAIVTALQALAYEKPLILLPVTLAARLQHRCIIARRSDRRLRPADLAGRRVGVRAYTQTTGVWVRGILQNDYGVAASSVCWVTREGAHVAEYKDPAWVSRAPEDRSLVDLLRAGEIDAAILGNDLPADADFVPVIDHPDEAAQCWFDRYKFMPVNHMLMLRQDVAQRHPAAVRALWRLLKEAAPRGATFGIAPHRPALSMLLDYCEQQALLPRRMTIEEIFAPAAALLDTI